MAHAHTPEGLITGSDAQQKYRLSTRRLRYLLSTHSIQGRRMEDGAMWINEESLKQYLATHRRSVAGLHRKKRVTIKQLRLEARAHREKNRPQNGESPPSNSAPE